MSTQSRLPDAVDYPDSDGKPMAENTRQYQWIVTIKGNLDAIFANDPHVFVARDNLVYAQQGDPKIVKAPDVYVAFGRPKGHRGSYKVWAEEGIFPQVVFEVLSPGNNDREMVKRRKFYEKYGAEEFYIIDPDYMTLEVWLRIENRLVPPRIGGEFVSPRLGVRFHVTDDDLILFGPNGQQFLDFPDILKLRDQEKARADRLAAKLRSLGIDLETV